MANEPVNLLEYEQLARERMDPAAFDYYAGAAGDEQTLAQNRLAFSRISLHPRVLVDVRQIDTATTLLGRPVAAPIALAPTAFNRIAHPEGEIAVARAAGAAGLLMIASTISTFTLEEIAAAATAPIWFQLYVYRDREVTRELVSRAEAAGYRALVLTVDTPLLGQRERDVRNRFTLPAGMTIRNLETCAAATSAAHRWHDQSSFFAYVHQLFDQSVSWDAIDWLQSITKLPLLLKGILTPEDARLAADAGAAGIVVSNHGGRQLDGAEASIRALPRVAEAAGGRLELLMDGGVRRGTDVLKAIALGARAVCLGRPYLWGLAVAGEAGVRRVVDLLREELRVAMALSGRPTIGSIDRALVSITGDE